MFIQNIRAHKPVSLVLIPLLGALLWLPGFLHPVLPSPVVNMPLYQSFEPYLRAHPLFSVICGFVFALAEAFLLNSIIQQHQVITKKSWLPALLFVVLSGCTPGLHWLHPELIAGLFLLGALHWLLGTYRQDKAFGPVFMAGLMLGMASLFYLPALLFFLFAVIVLFLLRPFIWREQAILLIGLLIPWLYSGAWFFWNDRIAEVTQANLVEPVVHRDFFLKLAVEFYALTVMVGFLLLVAASRIVAGSGFSTLKTKKGVSVMVWFLVFSGLALVPAPNFSVAVCTFAFFPLSLFISNYFLVARRIWIAEVIFILLLLSIASSYYLKSSGLLQ